MLLVLKKSYASFLSALARIKERLSVVTQLAGNLANISQIFINVRRILTNVRGILKKAN